MRVVSDAAAWLSPPTRAIWLPAGVAHEIVMKGEVATRFLYICAGTRRAAAAAAGGAGGGAAAARADPAHPEAAHAASGRPEQDRLARPPGRPRCCRRVASTSCLPLPSDRRALALADQLQDAPGEQRRPRRPRPPRRRQPCARCSGSSRPRPGLTLEAWRQKARLIGRHRGSRRRRQRRGRRVRRGYESPSAFIAAFKRQFGVTPGRYRAADCEPGPTGPAPWPAAARPRPASRRAWRSRGGSDRVTGASS